MDKSQALYQFFSSFGLSTFDENSVPYEYSFNNPSNTTKQPYLTYNVEIGDYGDEIYTSFSLWYYSNSWANIESKRKDIENALKDGGVNIAYDGGNIWIKKSNPFAQRIGDSNDAVKRYKINIAVEYH